MKVLVIGGGGREHALAYKVAQSTKVSSVFVAPGNAGTETEKKCQNIAVSAEDLDALLAFAKEQQVDLTIVGPEAPLVAGVTDLFQANGLKIFGPSALAAQLEGSKSFSKDFLAKHNIPTAEYAVFEKVEPAIQYVKEKGAPIVVKADGLAAGKGVIVAETEAQAIDAITDMLSENKFGDAGCRVVIEEYLEGEEASFIVMADGKNALAFATSQDHKRVGEGDTGLNTGGMGAYSPAPVLTDDIAERTMAEIIRPTLAEMAKRGTPYQGVLYAGLMIKDGAPRLVEYNVRFGDPECQALKMRLGSDLLPVLKAAADGELAGAALTWRPEPALTVVVAAKGYPGAYAKGEPIRGLGAAEEDPDVTIFHAGTRTSGGEILSNGGRVLNVTARG